MGNDDPRSDQDLTSARGRTTDGAEGRVPLAFVGGLVVGGVLLGLIWMVVSVMGRDPVADVGGTSGVPGLGQSSSIGTRIRPAKPSSFEQCQQAAAALDPPLTAARAVMDQWEIHVGAMNKLVVGAISLAQANAFWNQTRLGAERRIAAFDRATARWHRHTVRCPHVSGPRHASRAVRKCAREVKAGTTMLDTARAAVTTWSEHVRDMERLRRGTLAPATAQQMWLGMWRRGTQQVRAYRSSEQAVGRLHGCLFNIGGLVSSEGMAQMPGM